MIKGSVARRYAKALFELVDAPSVEATRRGLSGLAQALVGSAALKHVLVSPAFSPDEKLGVLSALAERLGCPPIMAPFLTQLERKNRVVFLPDIADAFAALVDQQKGTSQVAVTAAGTLSAAERDRIRARLRDVLRREVEVVFEANPRILSGLRVRIGSTVVDGSVRGRLAAMQSVLTKE